VRKRAKSLHGGSLEAPPEHGIAASESPTPPPAGVKANARARSTPPPAAPSGGSFSGFWSWVKLALGVLVAIGAALAVAWGVVRYAATTPRFAVTAFEVEGARKLGQAELGKLMGIELGTNIFKIDTADAERRLLADPWIRQVKVSRKLPGTLRIELEERDAVAIGSIGDHLYLLTRAGEPFKELAPQDPYDLPVVTGISAENLVRDRPREIERIALGLEVLRHYERVPMSQIHPAQEVHVAPGGAVTLTVGKSAVTLELGNGPWRSKLLMAERVVGRLAQKGRLPGIVFLDNRAHPERVVVRMK
jgi:cell division protein FtsQ